MIKLRKYLLEFFLLILILTTFACQESETIEIGYFKKPIDIASVSKNERTGLLILDNKLNQLFLYDLKDKCFLNFSNNIPLSTGLILPKYPYELETSDDNKKVAVVSSNGVFTVIDLKPYTDSYRKYCKQTTTPFIEFSKQLDVLPSKISMKKSSGINYEILLVDKTGKTIGFYNYDIKDLELLYEKTYDTDILYLFSNDDSYYISLKNKNEIIKIASDGSETIIDLTDISVEYKNIDKFIVTDDYIYIYSKYENIFLVWSIAESKFVEIPASYNPLDPNSVTPSKSLKLNYTLNTMSLYQQEYNIEDGEFLNGLGYLNLHQLIEGNYIFLTDVGGYFYFLTIDTDKKLIKKYPEEDYDSLDEYKTALDKKFLSFQLPLQTDYKAEVLSVIQSNYCTQFNRHEAEQCFSVVNEEENSTNNRYIILKDEVKNREYNVDNNYFKFIYEGALRDFISDDGSFIANNKLNSVNLDFSKLTIDADDLYLEVISELPGSKLNDSKCEKYRTLEDADDEADDEAQTNRKYFRLLPIKSINDHELTLDITNDENLSYCYDEAIAFQLRVNNLFLISTTENGEIGTTSYCTNNKEINPLCKGDDISRCPEECETAPYYENDLFKLKIFSDKGEMNIDSSISFSLGITSTTSRYRSTMVSPLSITIFKNSDDYQSKNGIAILDSYGNNIFVIDTNSFEKVLTLIQ